jgi:hypothetical protein
MRILHVAPVNAAGVPMAFVSAERKMGHESRLLTMIRNPQGRKEDVCLNLPFLNNFSTRFAKSLFTPLSRRTVSFNAAVPKRIPIRWKPANAGEAALVKIRERLWRHRIRRAMRSLDFWNYDRYHFDGGLEFYRDGRIVRELKRLGKMIVVCYLGSDLRTRGVVAPIDDACDLRLTVEWDLMRFHPQIRHVPFPLDLSPFVPKAGQEGNPLVIGHAPTNRKAKGSDIIIPVVRDLERRYPVRLRLIEGLTHEQAIEAKRGCDLFIDQIGDLGYGVNAIEALALGVPTLTSLATGFETEYPDHPFAVVGATSLESVLVRLIGDGNLRRKLARNGVQWVRRVHDAVSVVKRIESLISNAQGGKS